jgi:hypothetical protein
MRISIDIDIKDHLSPAEVQSAIDNTQRLITQAKRRIRAHGELYKTLRALQAYHKFLSETYIQELNTPFPAPSRRRAPLPPNGFEVVV